MMQDPKALFLSIIETESKDAIVHILDLKKEAELSFLCDVSIIQDSLRLRAQRRARLLAEYLIDEEGELVLERLDLLIAQLGAKKYINYPQGYSEGVLNRHQLRVLERLRREPSFWKAMKRFQRPLCHAEAERLIRETMGLSGKTILKDFHIRRAALSSCLMLLRQSVGSCFATAPAILIHEEQLENYLADLYELLMTGKLKRTFAGVEHTIPLSPSWGIGDLKKSLFLTEPNALIWASPGLIAAFEAMGFINPQIDMSQKIELMRKYILPYLEAGKELSAEEFIYHFLLKQFGLKSSELHASERKQHLVEISKAASTAASLRQREREGRSAFKAIADNALLKAWEFTLASFSEIKMEFSGWNLYSSLGFDPQEKGGIGEVLYSYIDRSLQETNQKTQEYQREYELAFDQLKTTEALLRQASRESEVRALQAEYHSRNYHLQACLEMRDRTHAQASNYSAFFSALIKLYNAKFTEYFQEIYDAEMQDIKGESYDDSPAGFRLVYKHGRSDASLWTPIQNAQQWIDSLVDFFLAVEPQIASSFSGEEGKEVSQITTEIVGHLRTHEFLETAMLRMAKAHNINIDKQSLKNLNKMEKKPWAYTSGGTMNILLKTYYKRENELTEESRWMDSESDLLIFIIDALKNLPPRITNKFLNTPNLGMLMHSPTHAFILHPGWDFLKEGWKDDGFTYTWVRDQLLIPRQEFYDKILLSTMEQHYLIEQFSNYMHPVDAHRLRRIFPVSGELIRISHFRELLIKTLKEICRSPDIRKKIPDKADSFLYQILPLASGDDWKDNLILLLDELKDKKVEEALKQFDAYPGEVTNAKEFTDTAIACYTFAHHSTRTQFDLPRYIISRARALGLSAPAPLIFADTNWSNNYFSFVVHPATGSLELWRTDRLGLTGYPMSSWKQWTNGTRSATWGIYTHPFEYGSN